MLYCITVFVSGFKLEIWSLIFAGVVLGRTDPQSPRVTHDTWSRGSYDTHTLKAVTESLGINSAGSRKQVVSNLW